jgi:hypothetical protein
LDGTYRLVPKIDMGPFAAENVINEIQIRQGKWISLLAQASDEQKKPISTPLLVIIVLISVGALAGIWSACVRKRAAQ